MIPEQPVNISAGTTLLEGGLTLPRDAPGIVVFAHGTGSGRLSPRNQYVARVLQHGGLATLLFDLLTPEEEAIDRRSANLRFDIDLLAARIIGVTDWLDSNLGTQSLKIGYFGASTGAGAALVAAAQRVDVVRAVVSRGGRPDLAGTALDRVRAPTLLIVGANDPEVVSLNRTALDSLRGDKQLVIVPGATHLFEEPGTLEQVASLAREWFARHLGASVSLGSG